MQCFKSIIIVVVLTTLTLPGYASNEGAFEVTSEAEVTDGADLASLQGTIVTEADIPSDIDTNSWARLPIVNREDLDQIGQHAFDIVVNPESRYATGLRGPLAMWLYSPEIAMHIFPASTYMRFGTEKDQRLTELAIIATARELNSQYVWSAHEPAARREGLEEEIINVVRNRLDLETLDDIPGLGDKEVVIIQFARDLISNEKLGGDTFTQAAALFGEKGVMDLAGLIGFYNFVNITIKTFDVQLAPGRERLLTLP